MTGPDDVQRDKMRGGNETDRNESQFRLANLEERVLVVSDNPRGDGGEVDGVGEPAADPVLGV